MSSHPTVAFVSENPHTNEIAAHLAGEGYNIERLTLAEFNNLNRDQHGKEVLKEAKFFVPLEDRDAVEAIEWLLQDTKVPVVGYVDDHNKHKVTVPNGVALLAHEGDFVTKSETLEAIKQADKLATSTRIAAEAPKAAWLTLGEPIS